MKRKNSSKSTGAFASPEIQQIEELLQFMTEHNLEEFEYSRGDLRIRLRKPSQTVVVSTSRGPHPRSSHLPTPEMLLQPLQGLPRRILKRGRPTISTWSNPRS